MHNANSAFFERQQVGVTYPTTSFTVGYGAGNQAGSYSLETNRVRQLGKEKADLARQKAFQDLNSTSLANYVADELSKSAPTLDHPAQGLRRGAIVGAVGLCLAEVMRHDSDYAAMSLQAAKCILFLHSGNTKGATESARQLATMETAADPQCRNWKLFCDAVLTPAA
jgi:hypothetical protein